MASREERNYGRRWNMLKFLVMSVYRFRASAVVGLCILAAIAGTLSITRASAYDTGFVKGPRVAKGESLYGVGWNIVAAKPRDWRPHSFYFEFFLDAPARYDSGFGIGLPRPIPKRFVFTAGSGSEITPYPESDVAGVAMRRVASIVVRMDDGLELAFKPLKPPTRVLDRHPWTKRFRVFDEFFSAELEPELMKAYDRDGELLKRRRSKRGAF